MVILAGFVLAIDGLVTSSKIGCWCGGDRAGRADTKAGGEDHEALEALQALHFSLAVWGLVVLLAVGQAQAQAPEKDVALVLRRLGTRRIRRSP